jgi:hypothetical protein
MPKHNPTQARLVLEVFDINEKIVVVGIAAQNNALALGTLKLVTKITLP